MKDKKEKDSNLNQKESKNIPSSTLTKKEVFILIEELKLTQLTLQQEITKIKKALVYLKKLIDENHKL